MRILLFGSSGMLGQDLKSQLISDGHSVVSSRSSIEGESDVRHDFTKARNIDLVINSAALTNINLCQNKPSVAADTNITGAANIAKCCNSRGIPLIYISTDQVYRSPLHDYLLTEESPIAPTNVYAMTKLLGEQVSKDLSNKCYILRTAWLFGKGRSNYIDYYRNSTEPIEVPLMTSNPTSTKDLSRMISALIKERPAYGIYNAVCSGYTTKCSLADQLSSVKVSVAFDPIRPHFTPLDNSKLAAVIGHIPTWQESLEEYLNDS